MPRSSKNTLASERILLCGASGLIGHELIKHLLDLGANLTVVSRFRNLSWPVETVVIECWDPQNIISALDGLVYDRVFNLAASGVNPAFRDLDDMLRVNVSCAAALVRSVRARQSFVHVGSCSEYAPSTFETPVREDKPLEFLKFYGTTKAAGTMVSAAVASEMNQSFVAARLFNVYGSREAEYRLLPSLVKALRLGQRVPLSPGTQIRDYLAATDVAEGLLSLSTASARLGGQQIVNLCSGLALSVKAFSEAVCDILGTDRQLLGFGDLPFRPDDLMYLVGDTTALHSLSSWRPSRSLYQGLREAVATL